MQLIENLPSFLGITSGSLIGPHTQLKGELTLSGEVRLHGEMSGTLIMKNKSDLLVVELGGMVDGQMFVGNIEILGKAKGTIRAQGFIRIRSSAEVDGVLECSELLIEPGAIVNIQNTPL